MSAWRIITGDVTEVLSSHSSELFDAVLSDPPYGLSFMAKDWDHDVPSPQVWYLVRSAIRPGASMFAFGGTRTQHRLTCAIEDGGFEIRDCLMWLYGSGFPKSHDISKGIDKAAGAQRQVVGSKAGHNHIPNDRGQWNYTANAILDVTTPATPGAQRFDGYGTALKPSYEPVIWAMSPRDGSFAHNATEHGVAGINIDAGRVATAETPEQIYNGKAGPIGDTSAYGGTSGEHMTTGHGGGRWPANVILDEAAGAALDEQTGELSSGLMKAGTQRLGTGYNNGWSLALAIAV